MADDVKAGGVRGLAHETPRIRWVPPLAASLLLALATGCARPGGEAGEPGAARVPAERPPAANAIVPRPAQVLQVDGAASLLTIQVYRGGPMAKAGHNHVIASHALAGTVQLAEPLRDSHVALRLPVASLTVDEPELRARAGADFAAAVPASARDGTHGNLLSAKLLDAAQFPEILLESTTATPTPEGLRLTVEARVRGQRSSFELPVRLQHEGATLVASGALELRQSQLGLVPFSVMMGALQVQDAMRLEFRIVARP